jgi:heme exporter protein D
MSEFFAMGGHGYYIWVSYGVTALFMIIEVIVVVRAKQVLHRRLARLARAESRNP